MEKSESKIYLVIKDYQSPYPSPILFRQGEQVTIGKEFTDDPDWQDWLWCTGKHNNSAWTPKQYITTTGDISRMNRDYNAMELSLQPGEILTVTEILNGFALAEKENGLKGWAPLKNITPYSVR
ncbi:MAG TPA: SH3 domain-containing protein [bacterium]|nr:SH3 domain-containing protein [bacterium]HPN43923.1 SH3 domain-containing protein [bacterium]